MKSIKKFFNHIFGNDNKGTPCWILAKEANIIDMVPGIIGTNLNEGIEVSYTWIDKTKHRFLDKQGTYIATKGLTGFPIYIHNVGQLFGEGLTREMISAFNQSLIAQDQPELPCIGSEYYQSITGSNIGSQMIETLEEYQEGSGIPWKWVLIIGGVIILAVVLWQTGILQSLMGSVTESVVPATKPMP